MTRKSLSDILHGPEQDRLQSAWDSATPADDFGTPLPPGEYTCHVIGCELFNARSKGTPGVKLTFRIIDGEHAGRRLWHDCWLTEAAMPQTKRDLQKLGVTRLEQLEQPIPPGIRAEVKLALRRDDDGNEFNRVKTFAVVGIDESEADPFAPADAPSVSSPQAGDGNQAADGSAGGEHVPF
jgi:hypothetical protein